jgi:hypothetical protein
MTPRKQRPSKRQQYGRIAGSDTQGTLKPLLRSRQIASSLLAPPARKCL